MSSPPPIQPQTITLESQQIGYLRALEICYYVWSGLHIFVIAYLAFYIFMLGFMSLLIPQGSGEPPVIIFIGFFGLIVFILLAVTVTSATLAFLAGRSIAKREKKSIVYVAAGICCIGFPIGTVLGVFTFIVMSNPTTKRLFDENKSLSS